MAEKKDKKKANELDELSLDELIEKCKQIKEILAGIENKYRTAEITEQSYKQTKESNTKKLNEVKKRLEEWGVKDEDTPAPAAPSAAPKPAAGNSAAPALVSASSQATAPASQIAAAPAAQLQMQAAQKTASAPVPPPAQAPVFTPPQDARETFQPSAETPVVQQTQQVPSAPQTFAQKLKQQFMPAASKAPDDAAYISQTIQLELQKFHETFSIELEHTKAAMDAIKDARASTDERIHMLTEGIAELRSTVFQREAGIKEQEMKLTKLKEMVAEIEPQKISKDFSKRDKMSNDMELRIEKMEVKTGDLSKTINEINTLLKSIGGLENAANVNHEASKKLEKIEEINKSAERLSSKIEKIYLDMNKRLERFNVYEARQDNISEIVNDMIRNFDALSLKFESYAEKKEMTTVKEDIADFQKKMDELKKAIKKIAPFAEAQVPEELAALQTEREDIESLLSSIEYEHEKKQIKDDEYASMKEKNVARLKDIRQKIADAMKKLAPAPEEKEKPAESDIKKQAPSLVDAMLNDKAAIKLAAEKNAEEAKKKEDAAKAEAESAPETDKSESEEEETEGEETGEEECGSEDDAGEEKESAPKTQNAPDSKPENIAEKTEPAKEKSAGKKKEPVLQKAGAGTAEEPSSDKTNNVSAPPQAVQAAGKSASEKKTLPDASGKTAQKGAPKKPRKSLRASEGLFIPAKEIAAIKSAVSPAIQNANLPAETAKGSGENTSASNAKAAPDNDNKTGDKADKISGTLQPAPAPEGKEKEGAKEENPLFAELDESLKEGLISKEAYENTKKLLMMG